MTYSLPFLDKLTMYRVVLYGLMVVWAAAIGMSVVGLLPYNPLFIVSSGLILGVASYGFNWLLAKLFRITPNTESWSITALILSLIVGPVNPLQSVVVLLVLAAIAMASKYVLVWRGRHIFNPAALAVLVSGLALGQGASWWVGNQFMLVPVALLGLLVVARTRRWLQVVGFLLPALVFMVVRPGFTPDVLLFSPLWFFASIMLTEPQTSPATSRRQLLFGAFVGLLFIGLPYAVPGYSYGLETSLLLGNLVAFVLWPARRVALRFVKKQPLAGGVWSFTFATDTPLLFRPGQFVELMLPHPRSDQRGVRRYFSVASAPHSDEVIFTTRIEAQPSSFKQALLDLRSGQMLTAVGPQGNFTLYDGSRPIVLIAGGIGVTPFLSMARQAQQAGQPLDVTLIYCNNGHNAPFKSELRRIDGLRLQMVDTSKDTLSEDVLHQLAPEVAASDVYLSGPPAMVMAMRRLVRKLGSKHIHTDVFIGY